MASSFCSTCNTAPGSLAGLPVRDGSLQQTPQALTRASKDINTTTNPQPAISYPLNTHHPTGASRPEAAPPGRRWQQAAAAGAASSPGCKQAAEGCGAASTICRPLGAVHQLQPLAHSFSHSFSQSFIRSVLRTQIGPNTGQQKQHRQMGSRQQAASSKQQAGKWCWYQGTTTTAPAASILNRPPSPTHA